MKGRILATVLGALVLACVFPSCDGFTVSIYGYSRLTSADGVEGVGTVVYIRIEGGFYGIVAGSDGRWDPINLPSGYMQDGLKVRFEAKLRKDLSGTHMWGTMVEILSISRI
jgi:hypothetical protein